MEKIFKSDAFQISMIIFFGFVISDVYIYIATVLMFSMITLNIDI